MLRKLTCVIAIAILVFFRSPIARANPTVTFTSIERSVYAESPAGEDFGYDDNEDDYEDSAFSSGTDAEEESGNGGCDQESSVGSGYVDFYGTAVAGGYASSGISFVQVEFTVDEDAVATLTGGWDIFEAELGGTQSCGIELDDLTASEVLISEQNVYTDIPWNAEGVHGGGYDSADLVPGHTYRVTIYNNAAGGGGGAQADMTASLAVLAP